MKTPSRMLLVAAVSWAGLSPAQEPLETPAPPPLADAGVNPPDVDPRPVVGIGATPGILTIGGYAEAFYQWNFNQPSTGITNFRGFDNRHNSFTIANVALDTRWDFKRVVGRLTLQVGHTPSTYYLAEPAFPGTAGANATSLELWKYIQQANVGYVFPVLDGLLVEAGIFLSPIGPEGMAIKDNWNWSRSNLFFGLPFYHTGARASLSAGNGWTLSVAGFNGWNSVVDGNPEKSVAAQAVYAIPDTFTWSVLYFGGVERPVGAPEGRAWRHLLDTYAQWTIAPWVTVMVQANGGYEPNALGAAGWLAGAAYGHFTLTPWLFLTLRVDGFYEWTPTGGSPIFWPQRFMASQTLTVDARPHPQVSFRLEYRHDEAGGPLFIGTGGTESLPRQDTLTLGVTSWF